MKLIKPIQLNQLSGLYGVSKVFKPIQLKNMEQTVCLTQILTLSTLWSVVEMFYFPLWLSIYVLCSGNVFTYGLG